MKTLTNEELREVIAETKSLYKPRNGQVLVAPLPRPESAVVLPESAQTMEVMFQQKAFVIAVGPGDIHPYSGERIPTGLQPGDGVLLLRSEMVADGSCAVDDPTCEVHLLMVHERSIIAQFSPEEMNDAVQKLREAAGGNGKLVV